MYRYAVARDPALLAQVHALNHRTFAGEIPQHAPRPDGRLVDRFHDENTYLVALDGDGPEAEVVGMMALRDRRPFSLDAKLPDLDAHLPPEHPVVEIRLLAVRPERRHGRAFHGLMAFALRWMLRRGHRLAIISGTTRQLRLYRHLGFRPFGPLVGTAEAPYQPMSATLADALRVLPDLPPHDGTDPDDPAISLLPGPVALSPAVHAAFCQPLVSHRGAAFRTLHDRATCRLRALVNAPHVTLWSGTGTLANDIVAAHLGAWGARGLVLSNGEFGERLVDHAARHRLDAEVLRVPWGEPFRLDDVAQRLRAAGAAWLWAVHGETSTGVLNDLDGLRAVAQAHDARLCLDAVSTVGAVPVDLDGVTMASGVSGKALGAPAGLAFVAHGDLPPAATPVARCFDLRLAHQAGGVPFTLSSALVAALDAALAEADDARQDRLQRQGLRLRSHLRAAGMPLVAPDGALLPTVQTVDLGEDAEAVGARLDALGVRASYRSGYLRQRGWLQLCTMGAQTDAEIEAAAEALHAAVASRCPEPALA